MDYVVKLTHTANLTLYIINIVPIFSLIYVRYFREQFVFLATIYGNFSMCI